MRDNKDKAGWSARIELQVERQRKFFSLEDKRQKSRNRPCEPGWGVVIINDKQAEWQRKAKMKEKNTVKL